MKNYNKIEELLNLTKEYNVFEFQGLLIRGYRVSVIKQYAKENPSKTFYVWLIDKNLVIEELKS